MRRCPREPAVEGSVFIFFIVHSEISRHRNDILLLISENTIFSFPYSSICLSVMLEFFISMTDSITRLMIALIFCLWTVSDFHYYFIVNNTLHELYFGRVIILWIKYNEAPAELYLIQNITTRSKYNKCTYYLF